LVDIGVPGRGCGDDFAVAEHYLEALDIVEAQPVLVREVADSACECLVPNYDGLVFHFLTS
jgi:hypothetical protein